MEKEPQKVWYKNISAGNSIIREIMDEQNSLIFYIKIRLASIIKDFLRKFVAEEWVNLQ